MTVFLADSNVLLDIVTDDPVWAAWSQGQLEAAAQTGQVVINPVVYAEMSVAYGAIEALDAALVTMDLDLIEIPRPALFLAAQVFLTYRRRGGTKTGILPEFFIGAHAAVEGFTLLTRDVRGRTYFPTVAYISPNRFPTGRD